ncbi:DUF2158 domain-containing protein, partial [candidate division TA06 bacterium]|nr:DUF2158 domain-containing protein [candidate division TA06 bacterium]
MIKFEVGNVVHLKSGSPDMTVVRVSGINAECSWIVGVLKKTERYSLLDLQHAFPSTGGAADRQSYRLL